MFKCPNCYIKISSYCSKVRSGKKYRYYKCPICSKTFKTIVVTKEYLIKKD